jgi:HAUS augmin-like complex subunit 2
VLRELAAVQRNLANLQVELQGRQDDEKVAHLTHVSEIQKKSQALAKTTATLQDVIHNKDRIIARLQQPYSLDCIPVETEYQRQFSELLVKAAGDYGALSAATVDIQWSHSFKDPPAIWGVHTHTLLASKPLLNATLFYFPLCYLLHLCFHRKLI